MDGELSVPPVTAAAARDNAMLANGNEGGLTRKGSMSTGYHAHRFSDKNAQMERVAALLKEKGFIPQELVDPEVQWFYGNLGIDDVYFQTQSVDTVAEHVLSLYGAKIFAFIKSEHSLDINLERETVEGAVYIHTSRPGVTTLSGTQYEKRMDEKYLDRSDTKAAYRLESYRSSGTISNSLSSSLRCYFISRCQFVKSDPTPEEATNIDFVSDRAFLELATQNTKDIYGKVMQEVLKRTGAVIEVFDVPSSREKRLVIGYRQRTTQGFFSSISDLYHYYELFSSRKYVEQFSNGVTIISLYLNPVPNSMAPPIETSILQVVRETSLIYCLPITAFHDLFQLGKLSLQESIYAHVVWIFTQHFINRLGNDYVSLSSLLDSSNPAHAEVLSSLKKRLRSETFTREYLQEIIRQYPDLINLLYVHFAMVHYIQPKEATIRPSLSFQRMQTYQPLTDEEIAEKIKHTVQNTHERMVFDAILAFNNHVLKTNFYQPTKVAISFRLDPSFLPASEYPTKPFGMFLVIGSEFRGFHVRFRDIARGGIRIIRSRNREAFSINLRNLFDENYNLASTQQRKNKDIPEGGSKGTILLDMHALDKPKVAFEKYVDSILDLLLKGETPGIKEKIVDLYNKPEILFFGPDEGTADYMDWAALYARNRGYKTWKAFTTGKSPTIGGIPHDSYGMTTRGVHQYVLGILRKLNLKEEDIRKLQTGGPDGDLGSNEIRISKDKTVAIVDGSGVIFDPDGLNRTEIDRLATKRQMINFFDVSKLGPKGFRVLVDETNVQLKDGTLIDSGLKFRNEFHTNSIIDAELFVPCGGRPESIDLSNWKALLKPDGTPRFKYIVEGANLFITQEARLRLEKAGTILFKDASANKGGVTSSSLEVLAALAFSDDEFEKDMMVKDGVLPEFYKKYVEEVQSTIENNADLEFECLWKEGIRTGKPKSILSDELSYAIVRLNEELQHTSLWDNVPLRRIILEEAIPDLLLERLGLDTILKRVPESYIQAIFGAYLASRFVYKYGIEPSQFAFFDYLSPYLSKVNAK
ncbi:NAD-dependent glutamate dehydrogenase [Gonapodya prolifera JEL478]|uniref:NAD-specific glutamate dehydrogenase n=1 Tax=Gonapodya prolifera (strain JEL478) TaxID=1344416 RepID=A0A139A731_GONPJ|nr:NAD-dependent glutamate dehydrogenase [Gonapodya prolifera JEL478]|eukprot:KXS12524.1 NAD-dependent glutamate dehydrogenase [Gonapodya prolifera JEL478]